MRAKNKRNTFGLTQLKQRLQQQAATAAQTPAISQPQSVQPKHHNNQRRSESKQRYNKKNPTTLSQEERLLFREAMHQVAPLVPRQRRAFQGAQTTSSQTQQRARVKRAHAQGLNQLPSTPSAYLSDYLSDPSVQSAHDDSGLEQYLNPACGTDVLLKLRRGSWPLEASIDLHGATLERAQQRLESFLQHCLTEHYRCLRIVHGKGYGSLNQKPILRQQIRRWLMQLELVLAYCDCPPHEGGSGAVKVLLRKNK